MPSMKSTVAGSIRGLALPVACLVAIVGVGGVVIGLSQTVGGSDERPPPPAFTGPAAAVITVLDVKQRNGDKLTLIKQIGETATQQEFVVTPGLAVERLRPITAADVQPGDWVTVIGIPDDVKNFSIQALIVFPAGATTSADGVARSKGGFLGHETARDPNARPIVGGVVERVTGKDIVLKGPDGSITVQFGPEAKARAYRLEAATPADVKEGDRMAAAYTGTTATSVLLLPADGS